MRDFRNWLILLVLTASTGAAWWLVRYTPRSAMGPAQVIAQEIRLSPAQTGTLAEVLVSPGQRVNAGQVIARLDSRVIDQEIAVAVARLRAMGAEAEAVKTTLATGGYETERGYQSDLANAKQQLDMARAMQRMQEAELRAFREEAAKQQAFVEQGLARRDRLDMATVRIRTLEEESKVWPGRIADHEERVGQAERRLRDWQENFGAHTAATNMTKRLTPSTQRVREQFEALEVLREKQRRAVITAPTSGTIVSVNAQPGMTLRAGEPVVVLTADGVRQVQAFVPERDVDLPKPGQKVRLQRRTGLREIIEGRVARVSDVIAPMPTRFWVLPQVAVYGREVFVEVASALTVGEALDATFLEGGIR